MGQNARGYVSVQGNTNGSECKGYEWVSMQGDMSIQGDINGSDMSECKGI